MATRALLLCGEEKAVQAVTQILDELEVSFEHSIEAAFALKRLANQRFDLLIVDCDNVQSATQVFNSARASHLNKTAIAIAIVEGKAGVPNAFRLGASLVLTKPVSLEQARNTLRTGIGMTRKDTSEVKHPAAISAAAGASGSGTATHVATGGIPSPAVAPVPPSAPVVPPATPVATSVSAATPVSTATSPTTAAAASATAAAASASVPTASSSASAASTTKSAAIAGTTAPPSSPLPLRFESPKPSGVSASVSTPIISDKTGATEVAVGAATGPNEPKPALAQLMATLSPTSVSATSENAAAKTSASAPQKSDSSSASLIAELAKPKPDAVKTEERDELADSAKLIAEDPFEEPTDTPQTLRNGAVPSFGGLSKHPFAGVEKQSSHRKGILIAALVLVLVAAGTYAAWMTQPKFRNLVVWEYANVRGKITGNHAPPRPEVTPTPQPVAAQPAAPVPASAQPPQTTEQAGTASSQEAGVASATPSAAATPMAAGTSESKPAPESVPGKGPTPQNAKQGPAAARSAAGNPVLVPAAASATPANVTAPDSEIFEVPEDYADDQVVHRVHPTYPHQARAKKLHGTVILQAIVNKQGKVDSLQLLSGDPILAQAAADAVKQWRYKPYSHNGEPAEFQTRVTVDFKLP